MPLKACFPLMKAEIMETENQTYLHYKNFFQELAILGLKHIVVSPGARSAPLSICADQNENFKLWIQHDERTAGFFALGLAKFSRQNLQTKMPVALICTSGTATANYTPAVIEAYQSCIPLLVLTADRPANYRGKGFEQTIFQKNLYGKHVSWSYEMPLIAHNIIRDKDKTARNSSLKPSLKNGKHRKLAQKIYKKIQTGPVHINCPIAEPLEPKNVMHLKSPMIQITPTPSRSSEKIKSLNKSISKEASKLSSCISKNPKGLILVGPENYDKKTIESLIDLSDISGWLLLADGGSSLRFHKNSGTDSSNIISSAHLLFGSDFYKKNKPDAILRIGPVPTNKLIRTEIATNPPAHFLWCDPKKQNFCADFPKQNRLLHPDLGELFAKTAELIKRNATNVVLTVQKTDWTQLWTAADKAAQEIVSFTFDKASKQADSQQEHATQMTEPEVSYHLAQNLPSAANLLLANSFPIRDFDTFAHSHNSFYPFTNRGANGIDGLIATALGISAETNDPSFLLAGDTAVLHDMSSLLSAKRLGLTLTLIIVNNNGGAIFGALGLAQTLEANEFERIFIAPTDLTDFDFLNALPGVSVEKLTTPTDLKDFLNAPKAEAGVYIGEFITSRTESMAMRRKIKDLISQKI